MNAPNSKVTQNLDASELFYPLTKSQLIRLCRLTPSDLKIFLYLKCLDPFGNQILEICVDEMMEDLGIKSLGTVYPSLGRLHDEGLIELVSKRLYVYVPSDSATPNQKIKKLKNFSISRSTDQKIEKKINKLKNLEPEPPLQADSGGSKIYRSNRSINIERVQDVCEDDDDYINFVINKVNLLPTKPAFPQEVIAKQAAKASTKREYLQYLRTKQETQNSAPVPAPQNLRDQRIETLRAWWERGEWHRVQEVLKQNPDWGISLDDVGANDNADPRN